MLYDILDAAGQRVGSAELKPGRRIMAVGRKGMYVVVERESGIQELERYPVP